MSAETARHVVERKELQDLREELVISKAETEKRSIASVSNYEELQKQMQDMQAKMRELARAPFEKNVELSEEDRIEWEMKLLEEKRSKLKTK